MQCAGLYVARQAALLAAMGRRPSVMQQPTRLSDPAIENLERLSQCNS